MTPAAGAEPDTGGWRAAAHPASPAQDRAAWDQPTRESTGVPAAGERWPSTGQQPYVPAPALPTLPTVGSTGNGPASGLSGPHRTGSTPALGRPAYDQPQFGQASFGQPESPASRVGGTRTGVDTWTRPEVERRHRAVEDDDEFTARRRRSPYGDEPAYGPVLAYTAGWYGVPALFYLIWLLTLDGDRQGLAWRQFIGGLPWLLAAIVLSFAVAGLLRWAVVGWRAVTLSFAAAVIGAGMTTIAHSLTL